MNIFYCQSVSFLSVKALQLLALRVYFIEGLFFTKNAKLVPSGSLQQSQQTPVKSSLTGVFL